MARSLVVIASIESSSLTVGICCLIMLAWIPLYSDDQDEVEVLTYITPSAICAISYQ